jgi:hypothetical protein
MKPRALLLSIGRYGWCMWFPPHEENGIRFLDSQLLGYGDAWREHLDDMADRIVGADSRTIPAEDLYTWAWHGPMCRPTLPNGMVSRIGSPVLPWVDRPDEDHDPRLGNAHGLDLVALDVYVELLRRFGGRTFDPRDI